MSGDSDCLAFDTDEKNRYKDQDGRLHVRINNISKANVCPYFGREIPGAERLGLKSDQKYMLLRDPAELRKAASTSNNIQLLITHIAVTPEKHQPNKIVGSTGTDAKFEAPYLQNSLVIWEDDAIAGVESKQQCQLSCGYRYDADMTPGEYNGVPYDGVMRNIKFNHVALVEEGRAGPDVMVGDSAIKEQDDMPKARDEDMDDDAMDSAETEADKFAKSKMNAEDCKAYDAARAKDRKAAKDKRAADKKAMDEAEEEEKKKKEAEDKKAADKKARDSKGAKDEPPDFEGKPKGAEDKKAMDAAISDAENRAVARVTAIYAARDEVRPVVGEIAMACDSAAQVYKFALDAAGVDLKEVPESAYRALFRALPKTKATPTIAMDAAGAADFEKRFPNVARITVL
jgi:hypothetical protein